MSPINKYSFECFLVTMINQFDVTAFWANTDRGGETPYDPRAMLGIILYGFCQGIFSSRKLEHSCRHNLGFMYVSGHNCPDHAAICRFLKKYDRELKLILRQWFISRTKKDLLIFWIWGFENIETIRVKQALSRVGITIVKYTFLMVHMDAVH